MVYSILVESIPQPLEPQRWDGSNVRSGVVEYVSVESLDLNSGFLSYDVFIWIAFLDA